jgi:hypothetical protein
MMFTQDLFSRLGNLCNKRQASVFSQAASRIVVSETTARKEVGEKLASGVMDSTRFLVIAPYGGWRYQDDYRVRICLSSHTRLRTRWVQTG